MSRHESRALCLHPNTGYLLNHGLYSNFCSSLFKTLHGLCTAYLSSLVQQYRPQRNLRLSSKQLFTVATVNSVTYGYRAFSFSAPILWNSIPDSIKNTTSLLNLPSKHSCFGNFIFDLFYEELYQHFLYSNVSALSFF